MKFFSFFTAIGIIIFFVAIYLIHTQNLRKITIKQTSLNTETWLEVEKNEAIKICIDSKVLEWKTSLNTKKTNDYCLKFQTPMIIGTSVINVKFPDSDSLHKINLAVGMKYLDFKKEEVLLGFRIPQGDYVDEEKLVSVTATYLVDKYPVTNCEMAYFFREELSSSSVMNDEKRKQKNEHTESDWKCNAHDYATRAYLYQALKYANARSIRDGLKPYYVFSQTDKRKAQILSEGHYIIEYENLDYPKETRAEVSIDSSSDGYRLPYYDEWMMFARAGDKTKDAPWGDSATLEDVLKYAKFEVKEVYEKNERLKTGNVGLRLANEYGLYDMFGLVEEHVLLERPEKFKRKWRMVRDRPLTVGCKATCPSYLKGGDIRDRWQDVNYGSYSREGIGGFRLIRNIGNNAKWTEVKSNSNE